MKYRNEMMLRRLGEGAKSTGMAILTVMAGMAEIAAESAVTRKKIYETMHGIDSGAWSGVRCSRSLYDLKRRGYLEFEGEGRQASVKFTDKARIKTVETLASHLEIDHRNRFISFDIPEKKRAKRDDFRQILKELGCQKIQSSLWVANRDISRFVEMAAYLFGIEDYVVYILAEKSDIDGIIDKKFAGQNQELASSQGRVVKKA